jgi:hypothetical protein
MEYISQKVTAFPYYLNTDLRKHLLFYKYLNTDLRIYWIGCLQLMAGFYLELHVEDRNIMNRAHLTNTIPISRKEMYCLD